MQVRTVAAIGLSDYPTENIYYSRVTMYAKSDASITVIFVYGYRQRHFLLLISYTCECMREL